MKSLLPLRQKNKGEMTGPLVRVNGEPSKKWGYLTMNRADPRVKDEVVIIQHPGGRPKQVALSHNVVVYVDDHRLQYLTDTLEGSSGSPVFDGNWNLVALHHKGGWLREPKSQEAVYRNQGININVIIDGLSSIGIL